MPRKDKEERKEYYEENKERILSVSAKWRMEHKKEIVVTWKKYYAEHKEERAAYNKEYCASHIEEKRARNKKSSRKCTMKKYGLTAEDYNKIFVGQGGVCAICGRPPDGKSLAIDHDHTIEKVRGLLCSDCNLMLGGANDSTETLARAIKYLSAGQQELPIP